MIFAENLTEGFGKKIIETSEKFNHLLILPLLVNTAIKPFSVQATSHATHESEKEFKQRRTQEICEELPIAELLIQLKLIEIEVESALEQRAGAKNLSMNFLRGKCTVTKRGFELGIMTDSDHLTLRVPIASRELLTVTEIEKQNNDFTSFGFEWKWKQNEIWRALDRTTSDHKTLRACVRERLKATGLTTLIPKSLEKTCRGVSDFVNTPAGWQLFDTTLEELL